MVVRFSLTFFVIFVLFLFRFKNCLVRVYLSASLPCIMRLLHSNLTRILDLFERSSL